MPPPVGEQLARSPLFRRLAAEDRAALAAVSTLRVFDRGEELFAEGDPSDALFVVVEGLIKVVKMTPSGKELILEIFGAGDPVGAVAMFAGQAFPAGARAIEPSRCIVTPRREFFRLLESQPSLVRGLLAGFTLRLLELTSRLSELAGAKVEERLARFLLRSAEEHGRPAHGGLFIPLALSRQELADMTGTTIETAIRVMSRWGKSNLVATREDGFVLLDRVGLARIGGLEPDSAPHD
jgi:CRP/FNR family transcriptional regulator, dissimilatory nitrate respiration regulator